MSTEYSRQFKIIVLGDSGVGKTSIISQYIKGEFSSELPATIGVEYLSKYVTVEDERIKLGIWDTAGQEKFRTLTRQFYRNVDGVIMVYDITRKETLTHIDDYWIQQLTENATNSYQIILVGNKSDLKDNCDPNDLVTTEMGQELARKHSAMFVEASAKTADHVQNAFEELVNRLRADGKAHVQTTSSVDIKNSDDSQNNSGMSSCC